jgi:hypothetical protein
VNATIRAMPAVPAIRAKDQYGTLAAGQVLQGGDEGQPHAAA